MKLEVLVVKLTSYLQKYVVARSIEYLEHISWFYFKSWTVTQAVTNKCATDIPLFIFQLSCLFSWLDCTRRRVLNAVKKKFFFFVANYYELLTMSEKLIDNFNIIFHQLKNFFIKMKII